MTTQELNRDVKKVFKRYYTARNKNENTPEYWDERKLIEKEVDRLYRADTSLSSLSKDNLLRLLSLNVCLRTIPFHQFGLMIDESKLM
jgi:hypothetical protein